MTRSSRASRPRTLANGTLEVRLLPARGAKITTLLDLRSGRQWLLPGSPEGHGAPPSRGARFGPADATGFDECLPNVGAGPHPDGPPDWPDHGEVWSRPWKVEGDGGVLTCRIEGEAWPFTFTRRLRLEGDTLRLEYQLENRSERPFPYLWAAHPLLNVTPGMRIRLPLEVRAAFLDWASAASVGPFGEMLPWPVVSDLDLSVVPTARRRLALKLFFPRLGEGRATLEEPRSGDALEFAWDPGRVPHLGLWLCYGGWPSA